MRMRSSDCTVKDYNVKPAISNWFSGAKTKRHILQITHIDFNYKDSKRKRQM